MTADPSHAAGQTAQVDEALDVLVNQFADPLSFVRELVQNSIDAGSVEIDVYCEWKAGSGQSGTAIIHVDDFGHGMDRTIIETKLTRLFSSDKEGDLTKIGKFGIGFVSVFAIRPDAVCLDTGRGGESWRVLFRRDRSYALIRLPDPIEGTKIQVIKQMTESEYQDLALRLRSALRFHCKHVEVELRFDGQPINEAFDLPDALVKVYQKNDLAEIVIGMLPDGHVATGEYYNRGLTLLQQRSDVPQIGFKIQSNYLEHTLSRDNIVHDENYERIVALRDQLLHGPLFVQLVQKLDALLNQAAEPAQVLPYQAGVAALLERGCTGVTEVRHCIVARSVDGATISLPALSAVAAIGKLVTADAVTPLVEGLRAEGGIACFTWQTPLIAAIYQAQTAAERSWIQAPSDPEPKTFVIERRFVRPLPFVTDDGRLQERLAALRVSAQQLLKIGSEKTAAVAFAQLGYEGSSVRGKISVVVPGQALATSPLSPWHGGLDGTLVVDAEHPQLQALLPLCDQEPELAAYALLKLVLLGQMTAERDSVLLAAAMEARWQRTKS